MKTLFNPKQQVISAIVTGLVLLLPLGQGAVAYGDSNRVLTDSMIAAALKSTHPQVSRASEQKKMLDEQTLDQLDYGGDDDCDDLDE